jgi:hypothetical protein
MLLRDHVAQTANNHSLQRIRDASRYFYSRTLQPDDRQRLVQRYGAGWIIVDLHRPHTPGLGAQPRLVYADERYRIFRARVATVPCFPRTHTDKSPLHFGLCRGFSTERTRTFVRGEACFRAVWRGL